MVKPWKLTQHRQTVMPTLFRSIPRVYHWLRLKIYQYEVTYGIYMLSTTEKIIFSKLNALLSTVCTFEPLLSAHWNQILCWPL
jgi:hypothetical protein